MKVFLDVDALHKLGAYNSLDAALAVLGVVADDVWILSTARFKLRLKSDTDAIKRHGAETATRLRAFIAAVHEITEGPTEEEKKQLEQVPGLDAGELILIAAAARSAASICLTGDKKALRALSQDARCAPFAQRLEGRVVCFEQVLARLMAKHGFEWLHTRVSATPATDRGITGIVAPGMGASEANAKEGLASGINALRGESGALLADF